MSSTALPPVLLVDLDDTILEFGRIAPHVWRELAPGYAGRLGVEAQALVGAIERVANAFWSDAERAARGRLDLAGSRRTIVSGAFDALRLADVATAHALADAFTALRDERIALLPGAVDALERARAAGSRLGLITNGSASAQRAKLARFDLARHFDAILIEGEFGVGKPDLAVYREALRRLDARPDQTWMVGDNLEWDVAAPQRLGIYSIWVDPDGAGVPAQVAVRPDHVVRALAEL
jgi:putative hydrolase of the HAD superfamily